MIKDPIRALIFCIVLTELCFLTGCDSPSATRSSTGGTGGGQVTAVYSRASNDYVRVQNPDGSFQPESYAFKIGGNFGGPRVDETIDKMNFDDLLRIIARSLANENYLPSDDPPTTKLLIVVYWGTTVVPDDVTPHSSRESTSLGHQADAAAAGQNDMSGGGRGTAAGFSEEFQRQQSLQDQARAFSNAEAAQDAKLDAQAANVLGYTDEILRTSPRGPNMSTLQSEIEHDRYYVVLLAYDYVAARKFGQHILLWQTRFSIPEAGNDFQKAFPLMTSIAAKYFGQDSNGLIHHNLGEGHVEVGEPKNLGTVP